MKHSFLPPSGASAWSKCAQWPKMNEMFPQDDSPASIEGTAAHWVGWEMLAGKTPAEGSSTPKGVIVSGEMLDGAELLCETISKRVKPGLIPHVEEHVSIPSVHPDCFGTPDVWAFDFSEMRLDIIDYKFGHRFVDEYFNPQGILYTLGVVEKIKPSLIGSPEYLTVNFTIVQPRCYHQESPVRTHTFKFSEITDHERKLAVAAILAYAENPTATTNRACGDCPGRHACSALQEAAYSVAEYSNDRQPHNLTPAAAALELHMLERAHEILEARVDGLRELTLANLKAGAPIPYYRIGEGRPRQQWNIPISQVITIGQMFGKDLAKPGVITPSQAKKLGLDEDVVSGYSFTPNGSLKLVAENPADARKVFGNSGE